MSTTITETSTLIGETLMGEPSAGDGAALTITSTAPNSIVTGGLIDGNGASWGLKLPNNTGAHINNAIIRGGTERALDVVRGGQIEFNNCYFDTNGDRTKISTRFSMRKQCDIGIKGGAHEIYFRDCTFNDVLLGDYSIYDHFGTLPRVDRIWFINCRNPNGGPIIVRALNANRPICVNTDIAYIKIPQVAMEIYFQYCRHFGDTRAPKQNAV